MGRRRRGERVGAYLRRAFLRDGVPAVEECVVGVLADIGAACWGVVVECCGGAEGFHEVEVARTAGCDDLKSGSVKDMSTT